MRGAVAAGIFAAILCCGLGSRAETPAGVAPRYSARQLTAIPNAQAIDRQIWLPGIDDGYVPQGIVFLDGKLFVSSYRSTDRNQDRGPCRLFALDAKSGAILGHLDLPNSCGHAGGVAKGMSGRLLVSDTHVLFEIELASGEDVRIGRVIRTVKLGGGVKGSFAASGDDGFWIGEYARDGAGKMYRFLWSSLNKKALMPADAAEALAVPAYSQGAALGFSGEIWVMRSGSVFGELVRLDRKTGAVLARFQMPAGAEGISFEADGALWTLSEAGSRRWREWPAFYPLALRFNPALLK